MQKHYDKKEEIREEYYKNKLEFETELDQIRHVERIAKEKIRLIEFEESRKQRLEAKKQALLDRPNPYEKEIDTCSQLIGYCNKLKAKYGLVELKGEQAIKQEQKQIINSLAKEDVAKKLQDGKLERVMSKKEREEEANMMVGNKKKGKKPRVHKETETEEAFSIDIQFINLFGFLKVSPPLNPESLEGKIVDIKAKMETYITEGEARLKEEEDKLEEGKFMDEEEEAANQEEYGSRGGFRGGRGGFRGGRGGDQRGGRGGARGGRGGYGNRRKDSDDEIRDLEAEEAAKEVL